MTIISDNFGCDLAQDHCHARVQTSLNGGQQVPVSSRFDGK